MQLKFEDLEKHLASTLLPIYLLCSDEPMQKTEALGLLTARCKQQNAERHVFFVTASFDWGACLEHAYSSGMFSERQLLTLYFEKQPDRVAQKHLNAYCKQPVQDTTLVLVCPKLTRAAQNSMWVKNIAKVGAVMHIWPIKNSLFPTWLRTRAETMDLKLSPDIIQLLARRTEGNLCAAHQALQRLQLLSDETNAPSYETVAQIASDMSQHSVFELVDSALQQDVGKCIRLLEAMRKQNAPPMAILSVVLREMRMLASSFDAAERGTSITAALQGAGVWSSRTSLMRQAYQRHTANGIQNLFRLAHSAEGAIKGANHLSEWPILNRLVLHLAGVKVPIPNALLETPSVILANG